MSNVFLSLFRSYILSQLSLSPRIPHQHTIPTCLVEGAVGEGRTGLVEHVHVHGPGGEAALVGRRRRALGRDAGDVEVGGAPYDGAVLREVRDAAHAELVLNRVHRLRRRRGREASTHTSLTHAQSTVGSAPRTLPKEGNVQSAQERKSPQEVRQYMTQAMARRVNALFAV